MQFLTFGIDLSKLLTNILFVCHYIIALGLLLVDLLLDEEGLVPAAFLLVESAVDKFDALLELPFKLLHLSQFLLETFQPVLVSLLVLLEVDMLPLLFI